MTRKKTQPGPPDQPEPPEPLPDGEPPYPQPPVPDDHLARRRR